MPRSSRAPIGLDIVRTGRSVHRAFEATLAAAGGSLPRWLILLSLRTGFPGSQRELAEAVGIRGATLTHHLNAMEREGLLMRRRDPENRRVHHVALTREGEHLFDRLRTEVVAFDRRLRDGLAEAELASLRQLLARLRGNVDPAGGAGGEVDESDVSDPVVSCPGPASADAGADAPESQAGDDE